VLSGPLEIASGYIGFSQYLGYIWKGITPRETMLVVTIIGLVNLALLYRRITSIATITVALWVGTIVTVLVVVVTGARHFDARVAPAVQFRGLGLHGAGVRSGCRHGFHGHEPVDGVRLGVRPAARLFAGAVRGGQGRLLLQGVRAAAPVPRIPQRLARRAGRALDPRRVCRSEERRVGKECRAQCRP